MQTPSTSADGERAQTAATNTVVWRQALPALTELRRRDIPVIVLKSLPQVEELYGDAGGRATLDVDLLVPSHHLASAFDAYLDAGFVPKDEAQPADSEERRRLLSIDASLRSRKWIFLPRAGEGGYDLDLHNDGAGFWRSPALPPTVWDRALPRERDGIPFHVLSPEDRLIYLCWETLVEGLTARKLADVGRAVGKGGLDRQYLQTQADRLGVSLCLCLVCHIAAPAIAAPVQLSPLRGLRYRLLRAALKRGSAPYGGVRARLLVFGAHDRPLRQWAPPFFTWLAPPPRTLQRALGVRLSKREYLAVFVALWRRRLGRHA